MKKVAIALVTMAGVLAGCKTQTPAPAAQAQQAPVSVGQAAKGVWTLSSDTDKVTGEVTQFASAHNSGIVLRMRGGKLDCFINTGEFLETLDNLRTGRSTVRYKFDSGRVITEGWSLGENNTSLFYPRNCAKGFLPSLRKAKTLSFQYTPADKTPESIALDVEGLPETFGEDAVKATAAAEAKVAEAAKVFGPYVHPCYIASREWCWSDPKMSHSNESGHSFTREGAIHNALRAAEDGTAFQWLKNKLR
jgi:hypothetical protein